MTDMKRYGKYYRFGLYLVVVVLVNLAGITLFFRADLTKNGAYSLSEASEQAVSTLSEPLTIKVFFTQDLPAPHNNTERYLRDLLEEYAVHSNRYFNYRFFDVSAEEGEVDEETERNQQAAMGYGIFPVQIQNIEQDEVKFQNAYMGMVLIHGDVVDKIPAITSTDGLEYTITSKIEKMNSKISTLLNLEEPVRVKLFFSSAFADVAPQINLPGLMELPDRVEALVEDLNERFYGKLAYERFDPSVDSTAAAEARREEIITLRWPDLPDAGIPAGTGSAGLVVQLGDRRRTIDLVSVYRHIFGTQYRLVDTEELEETIGEMVDDVIDINKKIGYLASHGTWPLAGGNPMMPQQQNPDALSNFNRLVSGEYSVASVSLGEEPIPEGIDCLIIAGPREPFSDWELFQIDQFLMKGKSLAILLDRFNEIVPNRGGGMQQSQPVYLPIDTGLEKLLEHYGASVGASYVLDERSYEQRMPEAYGGGSRRIYVAPLIGPEQINGRLPYMRNIKTLVTVKSSPIELREDTIHEHDIDADVLFTSSDRAWEMADRIDLSPWAMQPPEDESVFERKDLAVMLSGEFPSRFAGEEIPEREATAADSAAAAAGEAAPLLAGEQRVVERGRPGKIFLVGTSEIVKNSVLDERGQSLTATFVMNVLDHLNGRDDYAVMRSKTRTFNPLGEIGARTKAFVKTFNIAGLPVIVVAFGVLVWSRRAARKRRIQEMFAAGRQA